MTTQHSKTRDKPREFTGKHMLLVTCSGFAIVIGVNLTLAFNAVATFPGLETKNSYVASQSFEADRDAQDALNWTVVADASPERLVLSVTDLRGQQVHPTVEAATLGRATHTGDDQRPKFRVGPEGMVADVVLEPGYWNLRLILRAEDGTKFRRRLPITVAAR